ncbi:MAG TPA: hypothetical protein VG986_08405 [Pseudolabrys sp.]|nr:hypothetical protein [Pseudolabrys sp.]
MILMRFAISMFALCLLGVAIAQSAVHSEQDGPGAIATSIADR